MSEIQIPVLVAEVMIPLSLKLVGHAKLKPVKSLLKVNISIALCVTAILAQN